jgi:hypothetical protein
VTYPNENVLDVLKSLGVEPWAVSEPVIELIERLLQKHRSIESAAEEMKVILQITRGQP